MKTAVILLAIIVLIVALLMMTPTSDNTLEYLTVTNTLEIPRQNAYQPLKSSPDARYVYCPYYNTWLLPYEYLDFSDPYDRWMYYYYPNFYSNNYRRYWPFRRHGRHNRVSLSMGYSGGRR